MTVTSSRSTALVYFFRDIMVEMKRIFEHPRIAHSILGFIAIFGVLLSSAFAQSSGQTTFSSPEDAARAFFAAAESNNSHVLMQILGPEGNGIGYSGDDAEAVQARTQFVDDYKEMHRFSKNPDGTLSLVVGAESSALPIPLARAAHGKWYFETQAAKDQTSFRRIARNEMSAILACGELVDAQRHYFANSIAGSKKQYARKLVSDPGTRDGLYWDATPASPASPFNPLIAHANGAVSAIVPADQTPFHGYFFQVLIQQGPYAFGGAREYIVDGKMTEGFAFVAYPAQYRSSGVMTFIVNQDGAIYEKDLGPKTQELAETMTAFNPDSTWKQVD